jgi:hypothetical protein
VVAQDHGRDGHPERGPDPVRNVTAPRDTSRQERRSVLRFEELCARVPPEGLSQDLVGVLIIGPAERDLSPESGVASALP